MVAFLANILRGQYYIAAAQYCVPPPSLPLPLEGEGNNPGAITGGLRVG